MESTVTPTYEEGVRRGVDEEAQRQLLQRLIAVFERDASHATTLLGIARDIRLALGAVANCERQDVAAHFSRRLVTELERLVDYYQDEATEKRIELRDLVNGGSAADELQRRADELQRRADEMYAADRAEDANLGREEWAS